MKEEYRKKLIKVLKIILILIWMIVVFNFSNENGAKSSNTSRKVTEVVVKTITKRDIQKDESLMESVEKVIRKLAHYSLYAIGGILIISYVNTETKAKDKNKKILYSVIFGAGYAITDEIHQFFVSERSASAFDVGIDTLGIVTGIIMYLIVIKLFESNKK